MVSGLSVAAIVFSLVVSLALPVGLGIFFGVRYRIKFVCAAIGGAVFIVFSLILESILNYSLIHLVPATAAFLKNPWALSVYGGLAAGVFEECGRFLAFIVVLKKYRDWRSGVAYGIGHGGIEALLLGALGNVNNLIYALLINAGLFDSMIVKAAGDPTGALAKLRQTMVSTSPALFAVSGVERAFAFTLQLALSLLVLYGVKNHRVVFLWLAIFIHAAVDFCAGLYQTHIIGSVWPVEGVMLVAAVLSVVFIIRSKALFGDPQGEEDVGAP